MVKTLSPHTMVMCSLTTLLLKESCSVKNAQSMFSPKVNFLNLTVPSRRTKTPCLSQKQTKLYSKQNQFNVWCSYHTPPQPTKAFNLWSRAFGGSDNDEDEARNDVIVPTVLALTSTEVNNLINIHEKLGCANFDVCRQMLGLPPKSHSCPNPKCVWCAQGKITTTKFPKETISRASVPIYRMFTDLSGKKSRSLAGYYYYQLFLDDFSRKLWIYFLKKKSEAPAKIQRHITREKEST